MSANTPTSDSINKPVQPHLQNTFFFHCPKWKAISEPHCSAVWLRCTQFPSWIDSRPIYAHVVSCEFCLFAVMPLPFSWCWAPTTFTDECHLCEYTVIQKQPSFQCWPAAVVLGREQKLVGTGQKLGKVPGEEKFGQSGNGSMNFSLSPSRPLPPEPAGGSCFFIPSVFLDLLAPCLHSSPKSWRAVEAIAPAASQSLPPRARTQPVALGLCLKIA